MTNVSPNKFYDDLFRNQPKSESFSNYRFEKMAHANFGTYEKRWLNDFTRQKIARANQGQFLKHLVKENNKIINEFMDFSKAEELVSLLD